MCAVRRPRILVGCESSGVVRDAFIREGCDAWSCDLLPSELPGPHIQGNVLDVLGDGWDCLIAHPPCQYLALSRNAWINKTPDLEQKVSKAVEFARHFFEADIPHICIENPMSRLSTLIMPFTQAIQPWMFGHRETKTTWLWLKNLPRLTPTIVEEIRNENLTPSGQNKLSPSKDRWKLRARTYEGIAEAFATQWTPVLRWYLDDEPMHVSRTGKAKVGAKEPYGKPMGRKRSTVLRHTSVETCAACAGEGGFPCPDCAEHQGRMYCGVDGCNAQNPGLRVCRVCNGTGCNQDVIGMAQPPNSVFEAQQRLRDEVFAAVPRAVFPQAQNQALWDATDFELSQQTLNPLLACKRPPYMITHEQMPWVVWSMAQNPSYALLALEDPNLHDDMVGTYLFGIYVLVQDRARTDCITLMEGLAHGVLWFIDTEEEFPTPTVQRWCVKIQTWLTKELPLSPNPVEYVLQQRESYPGRLAYLEALRVPDVLPLIFPSTVTAHANRRR